MPVSKKPQRNFHLSPLRWAVILVVLAVGSYFGTAKVTKIWPFSKPASQHATADPNSIKNVTATPSPKNDNTPTKQSPVPPEDPGKNSDQVNVNPALAANIITLNEDSQNINFTATVQNAPNEAGTCVVNFSNPNDRPVTKQFAAETKNGVAACGPVSIPNYEFSYLGKWQVSFRYYTNSQQATAQSSLEIK